MASPKLPHLAASTKAHFTTDRKLEINNLFALVGAGIAIKLIFNSNNPANSTIWGYGLSSLALFLLLMIGYALSDNTINTDLSNFIEKFLIFH